MNIMVFFYLSCQISEKSVILVNDLVHANLNSKLVRFKKKLISFKSCNSIHTLNLSFYFIIKN